MVFTEGMQRSNDLVTFASCHPKSILACYWVTWSSCPDEAGDENVLRFAVFSGLDPASLWRESGLEMGDFMPSAHEARTTLSITCYCNMSNAHKVI